VILVDDRLALEVLGGRRFGGADDGPVATTWTFHYRLVRALADDARVGQLTQSANAVVLRRMAGSPPPELLVVLDPRSLTSTAATVAVRHGLNLLAAELLAAALVHGAPVVLSAGNVGRRWPEAFLAEGAELRVEGDP